MISKYLVVECDHCHEKTKQYCEASGAVEQYLLNGGTTTRSFWCSNRECGKAQVVLYKLIGDVLEVVERLVPSEVNAPHEPEPGITIRPRASKRGSG